MYLPAVRDSTAHRGASCWRGGGPMPQPEKAGHFSARLLLEFRPLSCVVEFRFRRGEAAAFAGAIHADGSAIENDQPERGGPSALWARAAVWTHGNDVYLRVLLFDSRSGAVGILNKVLTIRFLWRCIRHPGRWLKNKVEIIEPLIALRHSIHDWHEHADDNVHNRLARVRQHFVGGHAPKLTRLPSKERDAIGGFFDSSAQSEDVRARQAFDIYTASAREAHAERSANVPPEPLPEPIPEPEPETCASPDGNARLDVPFSLDNPPFETTEADAIATERGAGELTRDQEGWFAAWWLEYWLHRAKKAARDAFRKHVKTEGRFQQVMAATRAQKPEMLTREPSKRPHGATWLNGERWADDVSPVMAGKLNGRESRGAMVDRILQEAE